MGEIKRYKYLNSLLQVKDRSLMSQDQEELKKQVKEQSKKLAKLGMELSEIHFSYKLKEKTSNEYWEKRIKGFKKYTQKSSEYYKQVHALINLVNKEEAQMFLLWISKFHQLTTSLIELMDKIKENPSIINSKDRQQSTWSKEIKEKITKNSDECLRHEKDMNTLFRKFFEKHLRQIIE